MFGFADADLAALTFGLSYTPQSLTASFALADPTIPVICRDSGGAVSVATATVTVPHM